MQPPQTADRPVAPRSHPHQGSGGPLTARLLTAPLLLASMLLASLLLGGCGADEQDPAVTGPGPRTLRAPLYWLAREDLPEDSLGLNFRAEDPVQLQIIIEGADATPPTPPAYRLKAGETVRLWWRTTHTPTPAEAGAAPGEKLRIEFGFIHQPSVWTTANAAGGAHPIDVQIWEILAPPSPEPLQLGSTLELAVMAAASLPEGQLRIRPRPGGSEVRPQGGQKAVLRILVKAEAVDGKTR